MAISDTNYKTRLQQVLRMSELRIATWNLCLGLANKKDLVIEALERNEIIVCGLQETEIDQNFPVNLLSCAGYTLELEMNNERKRAGVYLRNDIKYERRHDLELVDCHVVVVDINIGYKKVHKITQDV